ncbi:hypothetical protein CYY_008270, partial [Polysphondylium violaceum]
MDYIDIQMGFSSTLFRVNITRNNGNTVFSNKLFGCIPPPANITTTQIYDSMFAYQFSHSFYTHVTGFYNLSSGATQITSGDYNYYSPVQPLFANIIYNRYYINFKYNPISADMRSDSLFALNLAYNVPSSRFVWNNPFIQATYDQIQIQKQVYNISGQLSINQLSLTITKGIVPPYLGEMIPMDGNETVANMYQYFNGSFEFGFYTYPFINQEANSGYIPLAPPTLGSLSSDFQKIDNIYIGSTGFEVQGYAKIMIYDSVYLDYSYPFGIYKSSSQGIFYKIPYVCGQNQTSVSTQILLPESTVYKKDFGTAIDLVAPTLVNIGITLTPDQRQILRIECTDAMSGVAYISIMKNITTNTPIILGPGHLVSGSKYAAIFEYEWNDNRFDQFNITIVDYSLNKLAIDADTLFYSYNISMPVFMPSIASLDSLKQFYFVSQEVEVTNQQAPNSLILELEQKNVVFLTDKSLILELYLKNDKVLVPAKYNSTNGLFQFDFIIPAKTKAGFLKYNLYYNTIFWFNNEMIYSSLKDTQVNIKSTSFDAMFPLVTGIVLPIPSVTLEADSTAVLTWAITVSDFTAIKSVALTIVADVDPLGYSFKFTATGDKSEVFVASVDLKGNNCKTGFYFIQSIETEDVLGNRGKSVRHANNTMSPLNRFDHLEIDYLHVVCPATPTNSPSLTGVRSLLPTIDSRTLDNKVSIEFTTSGLSSRHIPTFCLTSFQFLQYCFLCNLTSTTTFTRSYQCNSTLPYGFGSDSYMTGSVFGVADNYLNFGSFVNLIKFGQIPNTIDQPLISSTSPFFSSGGSLNISGSGYGIDNKCTVLVTFADQTQQTIAPYFSTSNRIYLNGVHPTNSDITIQVIHSMSTKKSNSFLVKTTGDGTTPPTNPPVTPTPSPLVCSSDCGAPQGNGKCVNGACVCNPPHSGIDCKAKTDNTTVIAPNPVKPSVNLTIPGTNSGQTPEFTSFVSVVAIREIDNTDTLINNYIFNSDRWILVKEGSSSNDQVTTVQYKYLIDNSLDTTIVSTVQVFEKATNITFGNQQLFMNPSTIKFTFNITSYPFSKSTNSLQLVMNAALESTEKVACS